MVDETRKSDSWGSPPGGERLKQHGRRASILSSVFTLLLTAVIIVGGFMLPPLAYPYLDPYHDVIIQVADPSEYKPEQGVFSNPIDLYPWNLYEEHSLRALTSSQRNFLEYRGIPNFLLAILRDHGLETSTDDAVYLSKIVDSFHYLEPQESDEQGCYVLVDLDISEDGEPDLRCAVDLNGTIISLLFVSTLWDTVVIESPIVVFGGEPEVAEQNATEEGDVAAEGGAATEGQAATEEQKEGEANPDDLAAGQGDTDVSPDDLSAQDPLIDHTPPIDEDRYIWSFAYAISREALIIDQTTLFSAFRQLDLFYEIRYSYSYPQLLPNPLPFPENLPDVEQVTLAPQPLLSDQYLLYIYNLPTGDQLILYIEPDSLRCIGFNLVTASPQ